MASTDHRLPNQALPVAGTFAALTLVVFAAGCSVVGPRSSPLPQDGPTLMEVYRQHMETEGAGGTRQPRALLPLRAVDDDQIASDRRAALDPLQQRFERLPNPDLVMHVYPHLSKGRYPVPGYVTVFPMYDRVEYALSGEVAPRRSRNGEANRLPTAADVRGSSQVPAPRMADNACKPTTTNQTATCSKP